MSVPSKHQAAYIDATGKPLRVDSADTPQPKSNEILVKVKAIAINPVDWKIQDHLGMLIKSWPAILGQDVAGEIVSVGEGVKDFATGQRVLAHSQALGNGDYRQAAFQEYAIFSVETAAPIPDSMTFEEASVLPLAISTASHGLYGKDFLGLPYPSNNPGSNNGTLLVWGGSSSNGSAAIQLGVASGFKVMTTCSPRNKTLCEKLGAKAFDYNSPSIVGDLVAALQEGKFAGAYDSIGSRDSAMQSAQVVASFGGGNLASVMSPPEDIPATVKGGAVFAPLIFSKDKEVGHAVWHDFLPEALAHGQIVATPEADVVGRGVESLQAAMDTQKKGVSGKKIVVSL